MALCASSGDDRRGVVRLCHFRWKGQLTDNGCPLLLPAEALNGPAQMTKGEIAELVRAGGTIGVGATETYYAFGAFKTTDLQFHCGGCAIGKAKAAGFGLAADAANVKVMAVPATCFGPRIRTRQCQCLLVGLNRARDHSACPCSVRSNSRTQGSGVLPPRR